MTASFSWLDSSERDRRRMHELLAQFKEKGTRDELGIATIRDAFADLLFPGTGSLQTHARYFFFVPWMYLAFEQKKTPANEIERRARDHEVRLMEILAATGDKGNIGINARANLKRLPSNIYWTGLRSLGFLAFQGSQDQFHREFDRFARRKIVKNNDGEIVDGGVRSWHARIPPAPSGFPADATFKLTVEEASFLVERIRMSAPQSFFAWWLTEAMPDAEAEFAWEVRHEDAVPKIHRELRHAENFSDCIHGASILYNLLLSRRRKQDEVVAQRMIEFDEWHAGLSKRMGELDEWKLDDFWRCLSESGARIGPMTRSFVEAWVGLATGTLSASAVRESSEAEVLIRTREADLKGALSRFKNDRALELWGGGSGMRQLTYRWENAVSIGGDLRNAIGSQS